MFLVDDILLFPARGVLFIAREIDNAAQQHSEEEAQAIRNELRDLYLALEAGKMSEADFDAREGELLDRLDALESPGKGAEDSLSQRGSEQDPDPEGETHER